MGYTSEDERGRFQAAASAVLDPLFIAKGHPKMRITRAWEKKCEIENDQQEGNYSHRLKSQGEAGDGNEALEAYPAQVLIRMGAVLGKHVALRDF